MRLICAVILSVCVFEIAAENEWLKDLESPEGLDMGYGVALKLNKNKKGKNVSVMERMSLDLTIGDVAGVSLGNPRSDGVELDFFVKKDINSIGEGKNVSVMERMSLDLTIGDVAGVSLGNPRSDGVQLDFFVKKDINSIGEERKKKDGNDGEKQMMQMIIGYKAALMASIGFAILKVLTMKAIFLAKAALIVSVFVLLTKLKDNKPMELVEIEQHPSHIPAYGGYEHHPGFDQHGYGTGLYNHQGYGREAQPSNIYSDIVYAPSATAAETDEAYASIVPNVSVVQAVSADRSGQQSERRKDKSYYRRHKGSTTRVLSVKKYPSSNEIITI